MVIFKRKIVQMEVLIKNEIIKSKNMKVLGVLFDYKMDWTNHINDVIAKVNKIQFWHRVLRKYLNVDELLKLVTTLGYSKLYYRALVWLSRHLHEINQQRLHCTSTGLIKACINPQDCLLRSFKDVHQMAGKPTPIMSTDYIQITTLKNVITPNNSELIWLKLQLNCKQNRRLGSMMFGNGSTNL